MRTIKVSLSAESFLEAAEQIEEYAKSLDERNQTFVNRLGEIGLEVVNSTMMSVAPSDRGDYTTGKVEMALSGGHVTGCAINLIGDQVLFIEFSAGVTFGQTSFPPLPDGNPYGEGMGVGTYPGQTHANDPVGWWYKGEWGTWQHTYGVRASMPMYQADVAIVNQIRNIASEVFGS